MRRWVGTVAVTLGVTALTSAAACSDDDGAESVTLVTYDSFPVEGTSLNDALAAFTDETGTEVEILVAGDTGTMLAKAELTAGNPEGDVMWGVDNTFLTRALDGDVFEPYESPVLAELDPDLVSLSPGNDVTPVDFGDVCLNYDVAWFDERGLDPPAGLDDLTAPEYAGLLVVENPATSSPGLAFLLATIAHTGEEGWGDYWRALDENDVAVVDSWDEAYYEQFTRYGGQRPLVVSYGTSPPAEVMFAETPLDSAPTGVIEATCFRQVEFAGVLRGTDEPEAARQLVDFLASEPFQREVALNLFVFPANTNVALPDEFGQYAVVAEDPLTMDPATIGANRAAWTDEWTSLVLG